VVATKLPLFQRIWFTKYFSLTSLTVGIFSCQKKMAFFLAFFPTFSLHRLDESWMTVEDACSSDMLRARGLSEESAAGVVEHVLHFLKVHKLH
jgi:hypothetical protein